MILFQDRTHFFQLINAVVATPDGIWAVHDCKIEYPKLSDSYLYDMQPILNSVDSSKDDDDGQIVDSDTGHVYARHALVIDFAAKHYLHIGLSNDCFWAMYVQKCIDEARGLPYNESQVY